MSKLGILPFTTLFLLLCFFHAIADAEKRNYKKKTYIVHMDKFNMPAYFEDHLQWYDSSLKTVSLSANMIYTYSNVIHGYSARLTPEEARMLEAKSGILSVQEEVKYELHTTRSPEFLGLLNSDAFLLASGTTSEVIVGVLDTGVWPESGSFDDNGLGPVPSGWKGECEVGTNFTTSSCNRKLIGARFFSRGFEAAFGAIEVASESRSPRDDDGHGTHTASTAAGSAVVGAGLFGFAVGTARGMARRARVAAYKVCWLGGCVSSDILAAMEKAIEDGVNVLSLSLGGGSYSDYSRDIVAIGAFAATSQGILVSCSAGNGGPSRGSLSNVAPWLTTVGAGTMDRQFPAYVSLGNGKNFTGASLYSGKPLTSSTPLVYAGSVSNSSYGRLCMRETLIQEKVKGKIVLCERGLNARSQKGSVVKNAGGVGMILANTETYGEELVADAHFIPTAAVGQTEGDEIKKYISSESNPSATIASGGTLLGVQPSPVIAAFSSRGPNPITPDILKPDLIAPGVNILAGWTGKVGPTGLPEDTRQVNFNIVSGTSMSCPHVSGLAALVKAVHPEWSPAAIRPNPAAITTIFSNVAPPPVSCSTTAHKPPPQCLHNQTPSHGQAKQRRKRLIPFRSSGHRRGINRHTSNRLVSLHTENNRLRASPRPGGIIRCSRGSELPRGGGDCGLVFVRQVENGVGPAKRAIRVAWSRGGLVLLVVTGHYRRVWVAISSTGIHTRPAA